MLCTSLVHGTHVAYCLPNEYKLVFMELHGVCIDCTHIFKLPSCTICPFKEIYRNAKKGMCVQFSCVP